MSVLKGSCLCGLIEYSAQDKFKYAGYCHCSECRKFSGSAFSAFGAIEKSDFKIIKGISSLGRYEKSQTSVVCFCKNCGSSLYGKKLETELIHIRLGSLDSEPNLTIQAHVYKDQKAGWHIISDSLPQFSTKPEYADKI